MEKKQTKRSRAKYSSLRPDLNLKTRYELISDYDYLKKLSEEELTWLNKFTKEYVNADLDSKNLENNLHNTESLKKDCYDRNNARNRCVWTKTKASNTAVYIEEMSKGSELNDLDEYEEYLITRIDTNEKKKKK